MAIFPDPTSMPVFCPHIPCAQVAAANRFAPPLEVVAAQDHRTNITGSARKATKIKYR